MRKLSLAALTVLELTPPEMIDCARKAGYHGVGLRLIPATSNEPSYDFKVGGAIVKECLSRLQDTNLRVTDIEILRILPDTNIFDFEAFLEVGALLGAKSALIAVDDHDTQRIQEKLSALSVLSKKYDITPHVEFMPWLTINTLGKAVDLLAPLADENISILLDTIHFNRSESNLYDWSRYHGIMPLYLQLCDTPSQNILNMEEVLSQARAERRIPGTGYIDNLADIVRSLPAETILSLEIPEKHKSKVSANDRAQEILIKTNEWLKHNNL